MGKLSDLNGVIGNFFTDGEELTPGQALARINRDTDENDFAILPLDAAGSPAADMDAAVSFSLVDCSNVAAVKSQADASDIQIHGTMTTAAWTFLWDAAGGSTNQAMDTDNDARKASTLIDQILEAKTRPAGWSLPIDKDTIVEIVWAQSEGRIYVLTAATVTGTEFAKMTASAAGRDFGE